MAGVLIYMAKVAAVLAVFYLFYRFLLRGERAFGVGRGVLLLTLVLAFVLPVCEITVTKTVFVGCEMVAETEDSAGLVDAHNSTDWWRAAMFIYGLGCAAVAGYMIYSMICVGWVIRGGQRRAMGDGVSLCVVRRRLTPFSWLSWVVISQDDYEEQGSDVIVAHERAHIELGHCYDLLFVNACCVVQWFNPAVWLLRKDLQTVHEYQADSAVLLRGYDTREYQLLLIKKAVGTKAFSTANGLNNSTLKKRITMMLKNSNGSVGSRFKLLYLVPLMALSLFVFSKTVVVNQPQEVAEKVVPGGGNRVVGVAINSRGDVSVWLGNDGRKSSFGTDYASLERYLSARIDEKRSGEYIARIQAAPRVQMGAVTDVKVVLRKLGVNTFTYVTAAE